MEPFDLIEFQQKAKDMTDPRKLFELWEDCCKRYDRNEIGKYELDEMKDIIWPSLQALSSLKRIINSDEGSQPTSVQRRKIS